MNINLFMRSDCPISFVLDFLGDKWTFLIVRDLIQGKRFYKDFLNSKEGIATNILSDRLKKLEFNGIVKSRVFEKLKTKKEYIITEKGRDLVPIIVEFMLWSDKYQENLAISDEFRNKVKSDKEGLIESIKLSLM